MCDDKYICVYCGFLLDECSCSNEDKKEREDD
jgi:hypothetical protein